MCCRVDILRIESAEAQESQSLLKVNDAFKKIIIVRNDVKPWRNDKGILIMGLMDFLLNKNSLEL